MVQLTDKQAAIMDFLRQYVGTYGYPPTLMEICDKFGWRNHASAANHLALIAKKGYIERPKAKSARCIRLLEVA